MVGARLLRIFFILALIMMTLFSVLLLGYSAGRMDGAMDQQLQKTTKYFKWLVYDYVEDDINAAGISCRNTVQGAVYITDDRGYICRRGDVDTATGCCKRDAESVDDFHAKEEIKNKKKEEEDASSSSSSSNVLIDDAYIDGSKKILEDNSAVQGTRRRSKKNRFSCAGCNVETQCCQHYELCVSCCLGKDKKADLETLLRKSLPMLSQVKDHFELCKTICRTSSKHLLHEREYLNQNYRYCYKDGGPPPCVSECGRTQKDVETDSDSSDLPQDAYQYSPM